MSRTPRHTHTHTNSIYLAPLLLSSGGSWSRVIWRIGQESRLCVFTWNLSCGNSSPAFLLHLHPSLSVFLLTLPLCVCLQFQFLFTYNIFSTSGNSAAWHQRDKNQRWLWKLLSCCSGCGMCSISLSEVWLVGAMALHKFFFFHYKLKDKKLFFVTAFQNSHKRPHVPWSHLYSYFF